MDRKRFGNVVLYGIIFASIPLIITLLQNREISFIIFVVILGSLIGLFLGFIISKGVSDNSFNIFLKKYMKIEYNVDEVGILLAMIIIGVFIILVNNISNNFYARLIIIIIGTLIGFEALKRLAKRQKFKK